MHGDWTAAGEASVLRVDGGMSASDWTMQFMADIIGAQVDHPAVLETTALGVARLAGMQAGVYPGPAVFARDWSLDRQFEPAMDAAVRDARYAAWKDAVRRTLSR